MVKKCMSCTYSFITDGGFVICDRPMEICPDEWDEEMWKRLKEEKSEGEG